MYDPETANLVRSAPKLTGLDLDSLPEKLSQVFAELVALRIRLRDGAELVEEDVRGITSEVHRLAVTYETLVSALPEEENIAAAAFVSATAHQLHSKAIDLQSSSNEARLEPSGISSDIAAMLLFLIAEAASDASEIARQIEIPEEGAVERELIMALCALADGRLAEVVGDIDHLRPTPSDSFTTDLAIEVLYFEVLEGLQLLARELLGDEEGESPEPTAIEVFSLIKGKCVFRAEKQHEEHAHGDSGAIDVNAGVKLHHWPE